MANVFEFKVTNKVSGRLGLGFADKGAGDTFWLDDTKLQDPFFRNYIQKGYIEPTGERANIINDTMMEYYDATVRFRKNVFPTDSVEVIPPLAANVLVNAVGANLAGDYSFDRKASVTGLSARFTIAPLPAATQAPRFLVTAGKTTPVTPTRLVGYDDSAGTYAAATNGAVAAAAPFAWAADDLLIIGYSEKFASVLFDRTTASAGASVATAQYWDGTEWVDFATTTDYTMEVASTTLSRAAAGDKARIVWWEMPDDWVVGGPIGSGATSDDYCVAIHFSGPLTNLVAGSFYPIPDTPIADINLGTIGLAAPDAVVQKLGAVYTDRTGNAVAWAMNAFTTTDFIWVGFSSKQTGFYIDVTGVNANAQTAVLTYWNGIAWVACPTVTDGSEAGGATWAQDGTITIATVPADWVPTTATDILAANKPAATTDEELYWLRYSVTGALDAAGTGVILRGTPGLNIWHDFEPEHLTFVGEGDKLNVLVVDENATIANLNMKAMIADI